MKVTLGLILAHGFPVPTQFVIAYSHLLQALLTGSGNALLPPRRQITSARALFVQDFPVDWARNHCCQLFLDEDDGDYLLFLDADMAHPPDLAHKLVARNVDVVTAHYTLRKPPYWTVAMRKVGPGPHEYLTVDKLGDVKGLMPIDAGGAGALLVSRKALTRIREHLGEDDWFRYTDSPKGKRERSEDMWFYEQARAAGLQPYLDADVLCDHYEQKMVNRGHQTPYIEAFKRERVLLAPLAAGAAPTGRAGDGGEPVPAA